jgi:hypothetical protein
MNNSSMARVNLVFLWATLLASAVTMLWLFWRFPIPTAVAATAVLICLGISARLAGSDMEGLSDRESGDTGIQSN